jgi:hypothetical protein
MSRQISIDSFVKKLKTLLGERYTVEINKNTQYWQGATILIHDESYCNKCCSCHCKKDYNISKEFETLISKYNYDYLFIYGPTIGLLQK